MSGSTSTLRVAGYPAGYPAEIDANVKIRWVDNLLINMSERSTDLLKLLGGPSQFTFNNPKVEWVEDDVWGRRPSHGGLAGGGTTALVVTGQAHRYPVGTLLLHVSDGEIARVTAIADANTLTLQRDVPGAVAEGAWGATDEVIVCGHAMAEDADWTFRPSAIFTLPYNYAQVSHVGCQVTFRRQSTALYGLRSTDLDYACANTVAEMFVGMEEGLVYNYRFEGASAARPALFGGVEFYVTAANGAQVTDLSGVALTRKDIDDELQDLFYTVGPEKMAKTMLVGGWGKRKISNFWSSAERLGPGTVGAGVVVDRINTDFGVIEILLHTAVAKNEILLLNRDMIKMGSFEGLGRPHLLQLPSPSATGPRVQRAFYSDLSCMVKGVQGMARIHNFSVTA
jgi:hypothetical protein